MSETKLIAVATQKGGIGKSTLTVLLASYLHYVKGINVAVVDCDFPQYSLFTERERELSDFNVNPYLKKMAYEMLAVNGRPAYPILHVPPEKALLEAQIYLDNETPEYLFFDLPGTINNKDVVDILSNVEHIICPMAADQFVIESSIGFCNFVKESIMSINQGSLKTLHILWNMVDARERSMLYKEYDYFMQDMGIDVMHTTLPNSVRFRRGGKKDGGKKKVFRSTLLPPDKTLIKGSGIVELAEEFIKITTDP